MSIIQEPQNNATIKAELLAAVKTELVVKRYSKRTIKSYFTCIQTYLEYVERCGKQVYEYDEALIKSFLVEKGKTCSGSTLNIYLCAITFLYKDVLKIAISLSIKFKRARNRLPVVLSRAEIKSIISCVKNEKHKLMILLAYGAGLRVSEVINLKISDLDFDRGLVKIINGKGGRDRFTLLPGVIETRLQKLIMNNQKFINGAPAYLFQSQRGGKLSAATIQKVFRSAKNKAGIYKDASFHSLRHSFATHLLENGTSISYIQKLLGHKDIQTTLTYTQVSKTALQGIISPLV